MNGHSPLFWVVCFIRSAVGSHLKIQNRWEFVVFLATSEQYGGVAQLGERTVRIRKVKGSNPSVSTKSGIRFTDAGFFFVFYAVLSFVSVNTSSSIMTC